MLEADRPGTEALAQAIDPDDAAAADADELHPAMATEAIDAARIPAGLEARLQ